MVGAQETLFEILSESVSGIMNTLMQLPTVDYHILDRASITKDLVSNSAEICLVCMVFCSFNTVHICSVLQINHEFRCSNNHM